MRAGDNLQRLFDHLPWAHQHFPLRGSLLHHLFGFLHLLLYKLPQSREFLHLTHSFIPAANDHNPCFYARAWDVYHQTCGALAWKRYFRDEINEGRANLMLEKYH